MWFKQCQACRLPETPDAAVLAAALDEHRFAPPCGLDWFADGFAVPQPFGDELVFAADKTLGISLKREERVLPGAVIKTVLDEKITKIEAEEARKVGRKERQELKEQIVDELLPRAFTRTSRTNAVLVGGYLLINQTGNKAENLLSHLREALGGLRAQQTVRGQGMDTRGQTAEKQQRPRRQRPPQGQPQTPQRRAERPSNKTDDGF